MDRNLIYHFLYPETSRNSSFSFIFFADMTIISSIEVNKQYKLEKKHQSSLTRKTKLKRGKNAKPLSSTSTKKRIKKTPPTKLKKILLELSLILGKIKDVDVNGFGDCITCKKRGPWWSMCGGHFVPQAKGLACKFEMDNINLQCMGCNGQANQGEQYKHGVYIDQRYGEGRAAELLAQANTLKSWSRIELEQAIEDRENAILELCKKHDKEWTQRIVDYIIKDGNRKAKCKSLLAKIAEWNTI